MSEYLYRGPAHICNRASRCADIETYRGCVPVFSVTDRHLFHTDLCTVLVPDASYRCLMAALASVAVYNWNACHTETINHTMLLQRTSQQQSLDEKKCIYRYHRYVRKIIMCLLTYLLVTNSQSQKSKYADLPATSIFNRWRLRRTACTTQFSSCTFLNAVSGRSVATPREIPLQTPHLFFANAFHFV